MVLDRLGLYGVDISNGPAPYNHAGTPMPAAADPVEYSVTELALLYERRKISPVEVVQAYIDRIEKYDASRYKAYNAFVPELALAQAKALAKRRPKTPLYGIPFAPKDNYWTCACSAR
jgi:aspartyl-tRNA(Asn)/glutamyl-tRNA(Gln) amidotransferase subunit A